jgi:hypothetical protein
MKANVRWQGRPYELDWSINDGVASVQTKPPNDELCRAAKANIEYDPIKTLSLYMCFTGNWLTNDEKKGEP